jgi:type I restriction enzyme R subunit
LSWFELVGWKTVPGDYLAPDGPMGARTSYKQAVLKPELRSALAVLNPTATPAMIDAAVRTVLATPSQDVVENSRAFHPLLASGVPVEINQDGETRTIGLRLLDRTNPRANSLLVANQFIVQGADEREVVRADVVVFVNGLPVALLEMKSPPDARPSAARRRSTGRARRACEPRCGSKSASCWRDTAILPISRRLLWISSCAKPRRWLQGGAESRSRVSGASNPY